MSPDNQLIISGCAPKNHVDIFIYYYLLLSFIIVSIKFFIFNYIFPNDKE